MNVSLMFILIRNWTIDQQLLFQITWRHTGDCLLDERFCTRRVDHTFLTWAKRGPASFLCEQTRFKRHVDHTGDYR